MRADPQVGDAYRQEFFAGEAEDMGEVIGVGETVGESPWGGARFRVSFPEARRS